MSEGRRGDQVFGTIPRMLTASAERFGGLNALEDGALELTYAQLAAQVEGAARGLIGLGVAHGDRVGIWAPNVWEWVVAGLAVHSVGGVIVPINTRYKGSEAAFILRRSEAKALLTINGFLGTDYVGLLRRAEVALPDLAHVVVLRGEAPQGTLSWAHLLSAGEDVSGVDARKRAAAVEPGDLSDILFTSGTTGAPKGAMTTHGQSLRAYRDWSDVVGLAEGDRYLVVAPFFHCFGYKAGWLAALMMGATVLPQAVFDANAVLERIGRDRVTMLPGPPALYQTILARKDLDRYDISSLRLAVTGAASIPVQLILDMRERLAFDTIITGYGLTEACGIATMCRYDDAPETIATTSGRAIPGVEVQVVDPSGAEVSRGEPGEVVVRGYNVMKGYFGQASETSATIDADGWLHTGDIGVMNADGYLRITDRQKDMFIVGGFNAYPAEIESMLLERPELTQAAVIGAPDARLGEVGVAFVVLKPGARLDGETLIAWCRERMANFKVPRRVIFLEALPMNATGKVTKFVLREQLDAVS